MERKIVEIRIAPEPSSLERQIIEGGLAHLKLEEEAVLNRVSVKRSQYGAPQLRNFKR